ncbi:MAG TPA: hypothetical protein VJT33_07930 [bacterium]|nr:hypothetical protein [bacterium]
MGALCEFYGKTPDELLAMNLEDFTLAFNCFVMLNQARADTHQHDRDAAAARQALASLG